MQKEKKITHKRYDTEGLGSEPGRISDGNGEGSWGTTSPTFQGPESLPSWVRRKSFHGRPALLTPAWRRVSVRMPFPGLLSCLLPPQPCLSKVFPMARAGSALPTGSLPPSLTVCVPEMYKSYHGEAKAMFSSNQSCLWTPAIPDVHPGRVFSSPCILHSRAGFYMPVYLPSSISCCCSKIPGTGYFRKKRDLFS